MTNEKKQHGLRTFDPAKYLDSKQAIDAYLKFAEETNDQEYIKEAKVVVERAKKIHNLNF